jgi:hypothetical protein
MRLNKEYLQLGIELDFEHDLPCFYRLIPCCSHDLTGIRAQRADILKAIHQHVPTNHCDYNDGQFYGHFLSFESRAVLERVVQLSAWGTFQAGHSEYLFRQTLDSREILYDNLGEWPGRLVPRLVGSNLLALALIVMVSTPFKLVHSLGIKDDSFMVPLLAPVANLLLMKVLRVLIQGQFMLTKYEL